MRADNPSLIATYALKTWDIFSYFIGMCVRIQTIALGVLLFKVETDHICIASPNSDKPVPREILPEDLNELPGYFYNMGWIYETVLMMLFICSSTTSLMYIIKVIMVCRNQNASEEEYAENVTPHVRRYKIWNTIFGLSHMICFFMLFTHGGRVCSGWMIGNLPVEE